MNNFDLNYIYKYFDEEKQASLLFLVIGLLTIIVGVIFYFFVHDVPELAFYRGAAFPLIIIGALMFAAGVSINFKIEKQQKNIAYNVGLNAKGYINETEMPRMKKVMSLFVVLRWIEIVLVITGTALIILFYNKPDKLFLFGVGLALTVQATIILATDFFAEKRAKEYSHHMQLILKEEE
jgi:hypothetical protein